MQGAAGLGAERCAASRGRCGPLAAQARTDENAPGGGIEILGARAHYTLARKRKIRNNINVAKILQDEHEGLLAIVGRPNVGKSTLFNKMVGRRRAIVGDEPGITRDRLYGTVRWNGRQFRVVDTGGIVPEDKELIPSEIFRQARVALDEAAAVVMVTDVRTELTGPDMELARLLQKLGKPLYLAVNKVDDPKLEAEAENFRRLGIKNLWPISAEHSTGVAELIEELMTVIPTIAEVDDEKRLNNFARRMLPRDEDVETEFGESAGTRPTTRRRSCKPADEDALEDRLLESMPQRDQDRHHRASERGQEHAAEPVDRERPRHRQLDCGHHARRHRRGGGARREALPVHRYGGHPAQGQDAPDGRKDERGDGAQASGRGRRGADGDRRGGRRLARWTQTLPATRMSPGARW